MPTCAVKWCSKTSKKSSYNKDGVTFHRFPKNPELKEKWIDATQRKNWFPSKYSVFCSRHFTPDCFESLKSSRRLYGSAIPTLLLPILVSTNTPTTSNEPGISNQNIPTVSSSSEQCSSGIKPTQERKASLRSTETDSSDDSTIDESADRLHHDDNTSENSHETSKTKETDKESDQRQNRRCSECRNVITGFRYVCVQCAAVELCGACEAAGRHELHYVLRVPGGKPSEEIESVLNKIREELSKLENTIESIKIEITEPDPLAVDELHIYTSTLTDNPKMGVQSRVTGSDITTEDSAIPSKRLRLEMEEFLTFTRQNSPRPTNTQSNAGVPITEDNVLLDEKDIKIEKDDGEVVKCDVFVHKDAPSSEMTMEPGLSNPGIERRVTVVSLPGLPGGKLAAALTSGDATTTGAPPVGGTGQLKLTTRQIFYESDQDTHMRK